MRWALIVAALAALTGVGAAQTSRSLADAGAPPYRLAPVDAAEVTARVLFLPDDRDAALAPGAAGERRLVITGAYTRADKFEPGGLVIRSGRATTRFPQRWDGVLLVSAQGRASLHHRRAVQWRGRAFNLDIDPDRRAFLDQAEGAGLSALQSHLLINEERLDLRPVDNAPRFVRRLLFDTADGRIGVYESDGPLTLYEAAVELQTLARPRMALNLDMGAYNFCEAHDGAEARSCGFVSRGNMDRLTNLIELRVAP